MSLSDHSEGGDRIEKKAFYAVVVGAMFMTLTGASPVLADRPDTYSGFRHVYGCRSHERAWTTRSPSILWSRFTSFETASLYHVDRSGTTDSGFTMIRGTDNFVANGNVEREALADQWRHPDGSKFVAQGQVVFNLNKQEVLVDHGSLRCLGNS